MALEDRVAEPERSSVGAEPTGTLEWGVVRASALVAGDRRLEASAYLSDGYGRRAAIETRPSGWTQVDAFAKIHQPSRLKGIVVAPERGLPFLSAGQVFEAKPTARKFLSAAHVPNLEARFVEAGWLLMSCSGEVGKVTVAHSPHVGRVITHDLLRIVPRDDLWSGWLYAYMRTPMFRSMVVGAHYGHMIKHVEAAHLRSMPLITVNEGLARQFHDRVGRVFDARDRAHSKEAAAFARYAQELAPALRLPNVDEPHVVRASALFGGRRRLEGFYHNPTALALEKVVATQRCEPLESLATRIFAPGRFRRAFGPNGIPYRSAEELFDLNAPVTKRIYAGLVPNRKAYMLEPGWIVMACSGQVYGLNGSVMLLNDSHSGVFGTHDLIRIVPNEEKIRPGYLLAALGHPTLGRPLVIRNAYGTSIPHLDVIDAREVLIPRLDQRVESEIADEIEEVARLRADADELENLITAQAEAAIEAFLHDRPVASVG